MNLLRILEQRLAYMETRRQMIPKYLAGDYNWQGTIPPQFTQKDLDQTITDIEETEAAIKAITELRKQKKVNNGSTTTTPDR